MDENGDTMDDCDHVGADMTHSWGESGDYQIRFHVTDDDGDSAEAFVNLTVVNLRPSAAATPEKLTVMVGEELVIWTNDTTDSASDMENLIYSWDFDLSSDYDDDGDPGNDLNAITENGEPLRHIFDTPGTKNIRLSVSDEGFTSTIDIQITVLQDDTTILGWIDSETAGVSNIVVVLGLVLVALLAVLGVSMLRNRPGPMPGDWDSPSLLSHESLPTAAPPTYAFGEAAAAPATTEAAVASEPGLMTSSVPEPVEQSPPALLGEQPAPVAEMPPLAPPVPATGLPDGWTMEQWEWYGEQWLKDNPPNAAPPGYVDTYDFDL